MDIYLTHGSLSNNEPNEFNYDVVFKQQTYLKLSSDMFSSSPMFSVAVLVNNLEYYTNTTGQSLLQASFMLYNTRTGNAISRIGHSEIAREVEDAIPKTWSDIGFPHVMAALCVILLAIGYKKRSSKTVTVVTSQEENVVMGAPLVVRDHNAMI